jgi:hypothetical protein
MPIVEVGFVGYTPNPADALVAIGPSIAVEIGFDPATFAALAGINLPVISPGVAVPTAASGCFGAD